MLLYHHGGIILLLFAVLSAVTTLAGSGAPDVKLELSKEGFLEYMSVFSGRLTDEKSVYFFDEGNRISTAEDDRAALYDLYYAGEVTEDELSAQLAGINETLGQKAAFELVSNQYSYIVSDPENRYFLYTNGWDALLSKNTLDVLLTAAVLLLITPITCGEYASQMDVLVIASPDGRKSWISKMLLALLTAATLCAFTYLLRYFCCAVRYGLPNPSYPLQSLSYFGSGHKHISLLGGYLVISGVKLFGFLYFALLILAISSVVRKYSVTLLVSAGLVLLPYFALSYAQYTKIPMPFSFMMAASFFMGDQSVTDYGTGVTTVVYEEPTWTKLFTLMLIGTAVSVLCAAAVLIRHRNKNGAVIRLRSLAVFASLCMCASVLQGCSAGNDMNCYIPTSYNLNSWYHVTENYIVHSTLDGVMATDRVSGETVEVNRDPVNRFSRSYSVFMRGDCVYYIKMIDSMLQICQVDLTSFKEEVVFEKNLAKNVDLLGVTIPISSSWSYFGTCNGVFLDDDYFYFTFSDDTNVGLRRVDRRTFRVKEYEIPCVNAFFDGRCYYYLDDIGVLKRIDLHTDETAEISTVTASSCYYYMDRLYYVNLRDKNYIYSCNPDGTDQRLEFSESCISVGYGEMEGGMGSGMTAYTWNGVSHFLDD